MPKFKKKTATKQEIPTASLPDIIFMLLFFFMVTTVIRETDLLVENKLPSASQLQKLEKKSLVSHVYVGKPRDAKKFGTEPRIQVDDILISPDEIPQYIRQEVDKIDEVEQAKFTVSLKIDQEAKMGVVTDVRQKLREANALKVSYASINNMQQ